MLDFAWSELFVVIIVAILVIGPKDIPKVMQGLGRIMRRIHYLKYAMSQQFEDLMRETELEEMRSEALKTSVSSPEGIDEAEADEAFLKEEEEEAQHGTEDHKPSPDTARH